jgi:16S rRNA (guanine527-N7)-methyltransferase
MDRKIVDAPLPNASQIEVAVAPMLVAPLLPSAYERLAAYLKLLTHWNKKINLTSVRDPDALVRLHFGECLRAAQRIPPEVRTVLDFGSGAGLPGIPIQIVRPDLRVMLAESQKKKAAFLREVVRELGLEHAAVFADRVEDLPPMNPFDLVTLRAVDKIGEALQIAIPRIRLPEESRRGWCMILTTRSEVLSLVESAPANSLEWAPPELIPGTKQRVVLLGSRLA